MKKLLRVLMSIGVMWMWLFMSFITALLAVGVYENRVDEVFMYVGLGICTISALTPLWIWLDVKLNAKEKENK